MINNCVIRKSEIEIIEVTPEMELEVDSKFADEELSLIRMEISRIKNEKFLHDMIRVGGDILGDIFKVEDYEKVVLLSEYIDQLITRFQRISAHFK